MTLREAYALGKNLLKTAEIEEYETDAWLLLEAVLGCTRNDLFMRPEMELSKEQEEKLQEFLEKRISRIPLQQILGVQYFCGLPFRVTEDVLCPRQDTEVLVEEAMKRIRPGARILDLCTGSGCILLSLLYLTKGCQGTGSDLSEKALEVAGDNAKNLGIDCELIRGDLFENIKERFDMIISNPPYIATKEIETLMPEVRDHEPRMALDGMEDGLYFYRKIIGSASDYLKDDGWLIFEIGYDQGEAVSTMMKREGFDQVQVIKDLAGLDRVVAGKRS